MGRFASWSPDSPDRDPLTYAVIGCAIDVHKVLGPVCRESSYEQSMCIALAKAKLQYSRQPHLSAYYDGVEFEKAYRPDLIVENEVVVEIKTVRKLLPVHDAQVLTYLRFSKMERGLLLNFKSRRMVSGIRRLILTR
jgi:GxxExxY protein